VVKDDRHKTAFTTPSNTFSYICMKFGLINNIIAIYEDDPIVFLKHRGDHVAHLQKVFERCREFGMSLNTKKSIFNVIEGKNC
jgi:hypothetical protein